MAAAAPARRAACALLGECRRRQARARDVLDASETLAALEERDRALARRLVLGTVSASGALDAIIDAHLRRRRHLEPRVRDALRLAAFELCWLSTPASIAVSQGVELVRSVSPRAAGLANAVLHRVVEEDAPARQEARTRLAGAVCSQEVIDGDDLALVSGYPSWLLDEVVASRGLVAAANLALAALDPAPLYVATNRALRDCDAARSLLELAGLAPVLVGPPGTFRLERPAGLAASGLAQADVIVSDLAAQMVVWALAPQPGERILEVGQGRATKTLLIESAALHAGGYAEIVGIDAESFKVDVARRRVRGAGMGEHVCCLPFDGRRLAGDDLPAELRGTFDMVVVDAPCSGTGTMRRHPEIPWGLCREALVGADALPETQCALLAAASARVAPGGVLAYSTCSLLRQENEQVVRAFLASSAGAGFEIESISDVVGAALTPDGCLQTAVLPGGPDAHFCARLHRIA